MDTGLSSTLGQMARAAATVGDKESPSSQVGKIAQTLQTPALTAASDAATKFRTGIATAAVGKTFVEKGHAPKTQESGFAQVLRQMLLSNKEGANAFSGHLQTIAQLRKDAQTDIG